MIHVSYFAKPTGLSRYSIARSQPKGLYLPRLPDLAPSANIFTAMKKGTITWADYTEQYLEGLDYNEYMVLRKVRGLPDNAVLCCWEKDPETCHRSLLAGWLRYHGIECEELP